MNFSSRQFKMKKPAKSGFLADRTGLEPATSAVTGRHSNQLNYRSDLLRFSTKRLQMYGSPATVQALSDLLSTDVPALLGTPAGSARIRH